jgi:hypothetical protein
VYKHEHTHVQQQFCAEDIELWGVYADVVVDLRVLPRLLHVNCAVVVVPPATTAAASSHQELTQQLSAQYYMLQDATTVVPDVYILLRSRHYELLVPDPTAWTNGRQLAVGTFYYPTR